MSGNEIRIKVDENNEKIRSLMDKFDFTLNNKLNELLELNEELRAVCPHEYEDGVCKWCGNIGETE